MGRFGKSTISRLLTHTDRYDCAFITAFRKYECRGNGRRYTEMENAQRNANLRVRLTAGLCETAALRGSYLNDDKMTPDRFLFVVNRGWGAQPLSFYRFMQKIRRLGELFDQNAVLIVPKGAMRGDPSRPHVRVAESYKRRGQAFFIRTNEDPENWMMVQDLMRATVDEQLLRYAVGDFLNVVNGCPLQVRPNNENEDCDEVEITAVHYLPGNLSTLALSGRAGRKPWQRANVNWLRGSKPPADYSKIFG